MILNHHIVNHIESFHPFGKPRFWIDQKEFINFGPETSVDNQSTLIKYSVFI